MAADNGEIKKGWLAWAVSVAGWLICAAICLLLTLYLEQWPYAYDMLFPVVLVILFGNIFLFLFIATRWGGRNGRLLASVARVCIGEALFLGGLYILGKYGIGA